MCYCAWKSIDFILFLYLWGSMEASGSGIRKSINWWKMAAGLLIHEEDGSCRISEQHLRSFKASLESLGAQKVIHIAPDVFVFLMGLIDPDFVALRSVWERTLKRQGGWQNEDHDLYTSIDVEEVGAVYKYIYQDTALAHAAGETSLVSLPYDSPYSYVRVGSEIDPENPRYILNPEQLAATHNQVSLDRMQHVFQDSRSTWVPPLFDLLIQALEASSPGLADSMGYFALQGQAHEPLRHKEDDGLSEAERHACFKKLPLVLQILLKSHAPAFQNRYALMPHFLSYALEFQRLGLPLDSFIKVLSDLLGSGRASDRYAVYNFIDFISNPRIPETLSTQNKEELERFQRRYQVSEIQSRFYLKSYELVDFSHENILAYRSVLEEWVALFNQTPRRYELLRELQAVVPKLVEICFLLAQQAIRAEGVIYDLALQLWSILDKLSQQEVTFSGDFGEIIQGAAKKAIKNTHSRPIVTPKLRYLCAALACESRVAATRSERRGAQAGAGDGQAHAGAGQARFFRALPKAGWDLIEILFFQAPDSRAFLDALKQVYSSLEEPGVKELLFVSFPLFDRLIPAMLQAEGVAGAVKGAEPISEIKQYAKK